MPAPIVVDDLVDQVRDQLDEENRDTISDTDILQALNRGQDFAFSILARHHPEPLLRFTDVPTVSAQADYDLPEDIFEDRLLKVEVLENNIRWDVKRISFRDTSAYETASLTRRPFQYALVGRTFRLLPRPSGAFSVRLWYLGEPETLVKEQGRVTKINTSENSIVLDEVGDDLSTSIDQLKSFVNIIDAQSGNIKATLQIHAISGSKVTFKSSPSRTTVLNRTVATALPSTLELDDYVCISSGVCVPLLKKPNTNFMIQYAVAESTRRLGGNADMEHRILKDFERQVERQWAGREQSIRVKKRTKHWFQPFRRYYT